MHRRRIGLEFNRREIEFVEFGERFRRRSVGFEDDKCAKERSAHAPSVRAIQDVSLKSFEPSDG
jgi:hypothetical protein